MPSWFGWVFVAFGVWMILLYSGLIDTSTVKSSRRALLKGYDHWQLLCSGIAFIGVGIAVAWEKKFRLLARLSGLAGGACLFAVLIWFVFFSSVIDSVFIQALFSIPLLLGIAGVVLAQLPRFRKKQDLGGGHPDPVQNAIAYWRYGRKAQAEEILLQAARSQPDKAATFLAALEKLKVSQ
jgi:hypothetical protein